MKPAAVETTSKSSIEQKKQFPNKSTKKMFLLLFKLFLAVTYLGIYIFTYVCEYLFESDVTPYLEIKKKC